MTDQTPEVTREKIAWKFCDVFTGGNAQLDEVPDHHRERYLEAADGVLALISTASPADVGGGDVAGECVLSVKGIKCGAPECVRHGCLAKQGGQIRQGALSAPPVPPPAASGEGKGWLSRSIADARDAVCAPGFEKSVGGGWVDPSAPPSPARPEATAAGGGEECPTCGSPEPHLHPAVQCGGEVGTCLDEFHLRPTAQNTAAFIALVNKKRATPTSDPVKEAREALRPFAKAAKHWRDCPKGWAVDVRATVFVRDLDAAARALATLDGKGA